MKPSEALRTTTHPQFRGAFVDRAYRGPADKCPVCATAVIMLAHGATLEQFTNKGYFLNGRDYRYPTVHFSLAQIIDWNDHQGLSFSEIADKLESKND